VGRHQTSAQGYGSAGGGHPRITEGRTAVAAHSSGEEGDRQCNGSSSVLRQAAISTFYRRKIHGYPGSKTKVTTVLPLETGRRFACSIKKTQIFSPMVRDAHQTAVSGLHGRNAKAACAALSLVVTVAIVVLSFRPPAAVAADSESGDKWLAPANETSKKNPVARSPDSIAAGQKVYLKRCADCHGNSGKGDGPNAADLGIHPAKLSEVTSSESDGALFWKITTGKKPMPRYGGRLSETERWSVINYLRTLGTK
jgi:mono/diheme cytochrome c family protein